MLIGPTEQEVASTLDLSLKYLYVRGREINLKKNSEALYLNANLGIPWQSSG